MGDHGEAHDHHSFEITREDLFRPFREPWHTKYVLPFLGGLIDKPVTLFREYFVEKVQRKPVPYYHQRFARVPDIDKCPVGDEVCVVEANEQFHRDRLVDVNIVRLLKERRDACKRWYDRDYEDMQRFCKKYIDEHEEATTNYFIKYGELHFWTDVRDAFMKQKHRMLWEREHGPIGAQQAKPSDDDKEADSAVSVLRKCEIEAAAQRCLAHLRIFILPPPPGH
nr:unnamed protein product [Spirometra erinaceieuropaei]